MRTPRLRRLFPSALMVACVWAVDARAGTLLDALKAMSRVTTETGVVGDALNAARDLIRERKSKQPPADPEESRRREERRLRSEIDQATGGSLISAVGWLCGETRPGERDRLLRRVLFEMETGDLDRVGPRGTALHVAVQSVADQNERLDVAKNDQCLAAVDQLLDRGSDPNIPNAVRETPLHALARKSSHPENRKLYELFRLLGARDDLKNLLDQSPKDLLTPQGVSNAASQGVGPRSFDPQRREAIAAQAAKMARSLNERRDHETINGGPVAAFGDPGGIDFQALNAVPAVQPHKGSGHAGVPAIEEFHAMGDAAVAPAPTLLGRASALLSRSAPIVAEDIRTLQAKLAEFQLPPGAAGLASSAAPLAEFVQWAKTAPPSSLPSISYGTLAQGELGRYAMGTFGGPGSITLNASIRSMPAEERSAVLFHELYHYWDKKVARLHYANVSYGYIDPAHRHEHEYDAYYMTALYWNQVKGEKSNSALAQFLDRLPSEADKVREMVNRAAGGK